MSSSSTCFFYKEDKKAKSENVPRTNALSEIGNRGALGRKVLLHFLVFKG
jgi:hypothetical protein